MKIARLFKNGQSQALRLPKDFRFKGETVFIKKMGKAVILLPRDESWKLLFESLDEFSDDFLEDRNQPKQQKRGKLFS